LRAELSFFFYLLGCGGRRQAAGGRWQAALGTNLCASISYVPLFGLRERGKGV